MRRATEPNYRTTVGSTTSYYVREIKNLYVIGQTYPQTEVPGPHSRKVTNMLKLRLQAIAARVCDHNPNHRVKIHKLIRYFPDSTELQMRQKLKDFMEYVRRGQNQGFWMMKTESKGFEEVMREVKPEDVVLSEAMLVGQRHLLDAGYGKGGEEVDMNEEDESKMDIEQQLAPWITTKNFLNATQNKAMLKLHGEGDPTGRGEGYNFVRVSMKDIFLREGETLEGRRRASCFLYYEVALTDRSMQMSSTLDRKARTNTMCKSSRTFTRKRLNGFGGFSRPFCEAKNRLSSLEKINSASKEILETKRLLSLPLLIRGLGPKFQDHRVRRRQEKRILKRCSASSAPNVMELLLQN